MKTILIIVLLVFCLISFDVLTNKEPSNDREWVPEQAILASATLEDDIITIHDIRNFSYRSETGHTAGYYNKTIKKEDIISVEYLVVPFTKDSGMAHTFLTFGFADGTYLAVSVEVRKEKGETYSPWRGLLNSYELIYVIADERDVIGLRTNIRKDSVYLYPIKAEREKIIELFVSILERANKLKENPEFYNTLTNNCTTNIVRHVNTLSDDRIPWGIKILLPGYSDKLAYDLKLIDTDLSFEEARKRFYITKKARQYANDPLFSKRIRE